MEEFLALPELDAGKRELVRGELIDLPPAKYKHTQTAHRMQKWLESAVAAIGIGGDVYHEMGYKMGYRHWLAPDVSLTHPDQPHEDYLEGAPLLAVEIVSEANTPKRIALKVEAYLANGAEEVWVVYEEHRNMWIHRKDGTRELKSGCFPAALLNGQMIDLDQILGD